MVSTIVKGDLHGWHIHGHNYTGVYYLEHSKKMSFNRVSRF